jgi:hypothetical protein
MMKIHNRLLVFVIVCTIAVVVPCATATDSPFPVLLSGARFPFTRLAPHIPAAGQSPSMNPSPVPEAGFNVTITTKDRSTGEPVGSVSVYLDGSFLGETSLHENPGTFVITGILPGTHALRLTKSGFEDTMQNFPVSGPATLETSLHKGKLVPLYVTGSPKEKIDVVFLPSNTTFNCSSDTKITTEKYLDEQAFENDVRDIVANSLFKLDTVTDRSVPLPGDYRDRFNIYYYYDPEQFADAFDGCAGKIPEDFWKQVPFADAAVILYPRYYSRYTGSECQPISCVIPGTGRTWMKIPADQNVLFLHEAGHAFFGLIDTYCNDQSAYWQNNPDPNVWSSDNNCVRDATTHGWDTSPCRQIKSDDPGQCAKQFWRWDPDPDIMYLGYYGSFGKASTGRITYVLNNTNAWGDLV